MVIANTGDDIEIYGAHVSPDPDLVTFWLADRIDERGWGLRGDTFAVMDGLRELGVEVWFNLGDRDLAWCMERRRLLDHGMSLTQATARLVNALGITARVLPMSDERVRTWVRSEDAWHAFQEFMIGMRAAGAVQDVEFRGADRAAPTDEVVTALRSARAIVIGPSNPVVSIGPILAVPGMPEALRDADAPVVAVSPVVGGAVLKGPTAAFMAFVDLPVSAAGVAEGYRGLLDGIVADEPVGACAAAHRDAAWVTPARAGGGRTQTLRSPDALAGCPEASKPPFGPAQVASVQAWPNYGGHPPRQALRPGQAAPGRERRRSAAPGPRPGDGRRRAPRAGADARNRSDDRRHARAGGGRRGALERGAGRRRPNRAGTERGRRPGRRAGAGRRRRAGAARAR